LLQCRPAFEFYHAFVYGLHAAVGPGGRESVFETRS